MDAEIFIYTLLWKLVTCLSQNQGTMVSSVDKYLVQVIVMIGRDRNATQTQTYTRKL